MSAQMENVFAARADNRDVIGASLLWLAEEHDEAGTKLRVRAPATVLESLRAELTRSSV